jgi:hypothetical protein
MSQRRSRQRFCARKSAYDVAGQPTEARTGFAVVQDNDAVVPQITHGVLDVAHNLAIGVEPVDQGDIDAPLLQEDRLVREECVAGRLKVVGSARLRVGELASTRRKLEGRVDGDLLVGGDAPESHSARHADLQVDPPRPPLKRVLHDLDPVHATILPGERLTRNAPACQ